MDPSPPEVISFGLLGVKCQVVVATPRSQVLNLTPVGRLVVTSDQTYHGLQTGLWCGSYKQERSHG